VDKLTDIETKLAHQDKIIDDLNDVVIAQSREIDRLKKLIGGMQDKLYKIETTQPSGEEGLSATEVAALNKPPHY